MTTGPSVSQIHKQTQVEAPQKNLVLPTTFAGRFKISDTTPSVKNANIWVTHNTFAVVITQFDDGQDGQTLYILGDGETTVDENSHIKNCSGNPTLLEADVVYTFTKVNGVWYQLQGTGGSSAYNGVGIKLVDWSFTAIAAPPTPLSRAGWAAAASASGGGAAAQGIDGNSGTRWATGGVVVPNTTYYSIDATAAISVAAIRIDNNGSSADIPATGNIQWSDDNAAWTTIAAWSTDDIAGGFLTKSWVAASHRYWRLLATSTPPIGTNWFSIYEVYFYATPYFIAAWEEANEFWGSGAQQAVWFEGVYAKGVSGDNFGVGIGLDADNFYGLYHAGGSSNILLVKMVAGVQTTLKTIGLDDDTDPHEFEIELVTPSAAGQNNWITVRIGRANNPQASASVLDDDIDMTEIGVGKFVMLAQTDATARGCNFFQLPATNATDVTCTSATGGSITQDGPYRVHTFFVDGTFQITRAGIGELQITLVGGGGGSQSGGPNGGGGGAIVTDTIPMVVGSFAIVVGEGGDPGDPGEASTYDGTITADGGGAGGPSFGGTSGTGTATGGKAGGASTGSDDSQGDTVNVGGGGGGAGTVGADGIIDNPIGPNLAASSGEGGSGIGWGGGGSGGGSQTGAGVVDLAGSPGSGGGGYDTDGDPHTGGGGGGAGFGSHEGLGGSGIVIVRYLYDSIKCG